MSAPAPSIVVADVHSYSAASDRPFALQRATLGSPAPPGQRHLVRQHAEQALERVDGYASQRPALSDWVALAGEQNVELRAPSVSCSESATICLNLVSHSSSVTLALCHTAITS